jgi:hypothetical protein
MTPYVRPQLPPDVLPVQLMPDVPGEAGLRPETMVLCINRGNVPLVDKFDGFDYTIPVGYFEHKYAAAMHFKSHQVVPGSRNPYDGKRQQSFIGILGIDSDADCRPFTDEELEAMGLQIEGIDRGSMVSPADRAAAPMPLRGQPPSSTRRWDASQQSAEAADRVADAIRPPATSAAERDEATRGGHTATTERQAPARGARKGMRDAHKKVEDAGGAEDE